jgi:HAE1 family hydrophobic/amphiphilic exporter-1
MIRSFYTNRTAVFFIVVSFFLGGYWSFQNLPVALYPPTTKPKIKVSLSAIKQERQEFIDTYGSRLEGQLRGIEDAQEVKAYYNPKDAEWTVEFAWGVPLNVAKARTEAVTHGFSIPQDWNTELYVQFARGNDGTSFYAALGHKDRSSGELYTLLGQRLEKRLAEIPGAEETFVSQPEYPKIRIEVDPHRLLTLDLTASDVASALRSRRYPVLLGDLKTEQNQTLSVVSMGAFGNLEELKNILIAQRKNRPIALKDVATVTLEKDPPPWLMHSNGQRGLITGGRPKPDANVAFFAEAAKKIIQEEVAQVDPGIRLDILSDPAEFIEASISNLVGSVLLGMGIATLVLFLFLGSFGQTAVIALSIPLSLFGGFIVMKMVGMELNLISLGGMALAVGMVVDGAVVVLENVARHFKERNPRGLKERLDVLLAAMDEVKLSVVASLLTTIIVFAPLMMTAPLTHAILGDLAMVIVCVLVISLFVTLYVVPPLLLMLPEAQKNNPLTDWFRRLIQGLLGLYTRTLNTLLSQRGLRWGLYLTLCLALGGSLWVLGTQLKREVMAEPDSDKVWFCASFDPQKSIGDAEKKAAPYEAIIAQEFASELTHFFSNHWKSGVCILSNLKDKKNIDSYKKRLEDRFPNTPEVKFNVQKWTPSSIELPNPAILKIRFQGQTLQQNMQLMEALSQNLEGKIEGVRLKHYPAIYQVRSYQLSFQEDLLRAWDPTLKQRAEDDLKLMLPEDGTHIKYFTEEGVMVPINLAFPKNLIQRPGDISNHLLRVQGQILPLRHFVDIKESQTFAQIYREQGRDAVRLEIKAQESFKGDREALKEQLLEMIRALPLDQNLLVFEPTDRVVTENLHSLGFALALALILIWILMSLQFGSLSHVMIIMLAIPLGLIGVGLSLYVFQSTLSVNSMLGMILLAGTAVNNSIIFIDFFNQSRLAYPALSLTDQILRTASLRFQPILITTLTTILGMLPISFGLGDGGEILQPLGIAVCGGLTVSTFLTLIVVPLVLYASESKRSPVL